MAFAGNSAGRVGQSRYWAMFGINILAMAGLLLGGGFALLQGSYGLALLLVAAIAPLGIYWRVIMMRRCRDIGWPASAPWVIFGVQMALSFSLGFNRGAAAGSALLLPSLLALADFVFTIVIGCIATKQAVDYDAIFGDGPEMAQRPRPRDAASLGGGADGFDDAPLPGGTDRFDAAIARALEKRRRTEAAERGAARPAQPAPAFPARPSGGFGRRVVS